jgi:hypothetical protein
MPIDSKLAHGIARNSFQTIMSFGSGLQNLLLHFHHRNKTQVTTPKGARMMIAQVRRYIITCAFWMAEMETNREGPAIHWLFFLPDSEGDIKLSAARYAPLNRNLLLNSKTLAIIKKHALARAHQRLDEADWQDVLKDLRHASLMLVPMREVARILGNKQIFLTTGDGVLVGEVREDGLLQMNTYLHSDRLSARWQQVARAARECLESFDTDKDGLITKLTNALMFDSTHELDDLVATLSQTLSQPRFDWLRDSYQQGEDVQEAIWNSAKAEASREAHSG